MTKHRTRGKKRKKELSRRDFVKQGAAVGTAMLVGTSALGAAEAAETAGPSSAPSLAPSLHVGFPIGDRNFEVRTRADTGSVNLGVARQAILFAIGDVLIPSAPGDPGYRDLEWHGITEEVSTRTEIRDGDLDLFNRSSEGVLGKPFTELGGKERADYLHRIIDGSASKDESVQAKLVETYLHVREMVFTIYYQNYPEDSWPRDARGVPLLKPGDAHQVTNPNTARVATGWNLAGYSGPLTWEEEERRRRYFKKIKWQE